MNCKSVSVMMAPVSVLCNQISSSWRFYLLTISNEFNDTRFQKVLKFFLHISELLVTFETLPHYPKIDSSYWLKEDVQWIPDKFFREKLMVSNGFDLFFLQE